jgi:hypothetical protein
MVLTKGHQRVGMASVGTSPQELPHPWELVGWQDSQGH